MNTKNTAPEVTPAITEADVVAFLASITSGVHERTASLCESLVFDLPRVEVGTNYRPFCINAWKGANYAYGYGATVAQAEAEFVTELKRKQPRPEKLRADAAALIAQAEKIETTSKEGA